MLPSLTPLQVNVIIRYLERSRAIVIDTEGYITWVRKELPDQLTLGEVPAFAERLGIAPAIVVGRLQHDGLLPFSHGNKLRRRFRSFEHAAWHRRDRVAP